MRPIDAVLFDLDDTLHDDTRAYHNAAERVAREIEAEHGIDAASLKAAYVAEAECFWKRLGPDDLKQRLAPARTMMWGAALAKSGMHDGEMAQRSAERYNAYRRSELVPFPGALDVLRTLRERGRRLGLLTNGFSETHREKIELLRMADAFDAIFIADEVGMLKPDPLLFAHACQELGVSPSKTAMVGDRYDRDIKGALEAGLFTIWMKVRDEALPHGAVPPHATVSSIAEVLALL